MLFALDETSAASERSAAETAGLQGAAQRRSEPRPGARARGARTPTSARPIDDANDILLAAVHVADAGHDEPLGPPRRARPARPASSTASASPSSRGSPRASRERRRPRASASARGRRSRSASRTSCCSSTRERHALAHTAVAILDALDVPEAEGTAKPDTYAAMVELTAPVVARRPRRATRAIARAARACPRRGRDACSAPASTPPAPSATSCTSRPSATTGSSPAARAAAPHADLRRPRARRDARRRDRHPGVQRAARPPARARRAGRELAVLVRRRLGPAECARAALPRPARRRDPARVRLLRRLRRDVDRGGRRGRPRGLHVPVVGPAPAPAPGHGRGPRDGRPVGALGRRGARRRSSTGSRRARPTRRRGEPARPPTPREALVEATFAAAPRRPRRDAAVRRSAAPGARGGARDASTSRARTRATSATPARSTAVERIRREGNGADRQRAAYARGGDARRCSSCWSRRRRRPTRRRRRCRRATAS